MWALSVGLSVGLIFGLDTVIKHYTLRTIFWLDGSMPFHYVRFLDACADRIQLRKVGSGYMFIHRTFLEHIAALTPERIEDLAARIDAVCHCAGAPISTHPSSTAREKAITHCWGYCRRRRRLTIRHGMVRCICPLFVHSCPS